MKRFLFQILILLLSAGAFAQGTADLVADPSAKKILEKKCIRFGTSEILPIKFETACNALNQPQLLEAIQNEFCRSVSQNGTVDFPIIETAPGTYYYITEKGKRTNITELYKKQTDEASFDYIIHASGKRSFGKYDVIVHLQIVDAGSAGIIYSVKVHIWPHNWLTRSSHKIGLTKRFFKKKMQLTSYVAREVGVGLCEQEEFRSQLKTSISAVRRR